MEAYRLIENLPWSPHPVVKGVQIKPLVSKKQDGLDVTCMLVKVPAGTEVPEHIHPDQDDILYPVSGKATMWVDGFETFSLHPGTFVRVPKGTKHRIYGVVEELLIYDVFHPALL